MHRGFMHRLRRRPRCGALEPTGSAWEAQLHGAGSVFVAEVASTPPRVGYVAPTLTLMGLPASHSHIAMPSQLAPLGCQPAIAEIARLLPFALSACFGVFDSCRDSARLYQPQPGLSQAVSASAGTLQTKKSNQLFPGAIPSMRQGDQRVIVFAERVHVGRERMTFELNPRQI